ncbi:carbohydrate ABC transporter permease [Nonomuraea sp. NPDC059007]|uniref:carbohydrate ABC transporter permease n=1 Tax=Nonomuraea sp. NPDC059007 TaxID=3346692 RepID=UPI0036B5FCBB
MALGTLAPPRPPRAAPRPARSSRSRRRAGYLMVAPAFLHMLLWTGLPLVAAVFLAFTSYDILSAPEFVGLANFTEMFGDPVFRRAVLNTVIYAIFTVPVAMGIALVIAVLLNGNVRGRRLFRTAVFLPQVTATIAVALVWLWIYNPRGGLLNAVLSFFGVAGPSWLSSTTWALPAVIAVGVWQGIGMKMLIYLAALQNLPPELYEAASVDGASKVRQFFKITVPLLRPATFFVFVTSVIGAFQSFDQIYVLTDGGPAHSTTMITYEVYKSAFREFRMGYACAQSLVLFTILIALTLINRRVIGGDRVTA